jgi:hypothetical protein
MAIDYSIAVEIVCNPKQIADARFFEDVAVNRGLTVRVFTERDAATDWLKQSLPVSAG